MSIAWMMWLIPGGMLVLMGFMWLLMKIATAGPPGVREGYITGVVGRMGQGKSLYVMTLARKHLANGGSVISNFRIDTTKTGGDWTEFKGWIELLEVLVSRLERAEKDREGRPIIPAALVLLDEAHLYAPANGQVLPDVARWILSHLRKLRAEMMWCTQHEARIASALAQQTSEIVLVKRKAVRARHFVASHWEPEKFRKLNGECLFKIEYGLKKDVLAMYNSWDLIAPDAHGDERGVVDSMMKRLAALGSDATVTPIQQKEQVS